MKRGMIERFLSERTFTASMVALIVFALALVASIKIPIEVMPKENTPAFLYVNVSSLKKMSPEKQEIFLTVPLEGALRTLPSVQSFQTKTSSSSVTVSLTYDPGTNLELAETLLRESLQGLANKRIIDMKMVKVTRFNPEASAIVRIGISNEAGVIPQKVIKEVIQAKLESLSEISKVEVQGGAPETFEYRISPVRLAQLGIEAAQIGSLLQFEDMRYPMGSVRLGRNLPVTGRLVTNQLDEVRNQVMKEGTENSLREIASEQRTKSTDREIRRQNGANAAFVEIFGRDGANLFDLDREVKRVLAEVGEEEGLNFEFVFNKVEQLKLAIEKVFSALLQSILITSAVIFFFMRRFSLTLIIVSAIPFSLLITVLLMYIKGASLNLLTLSGLIISIGLMVDNAIIVVERMDQLRKKTGKADISTLAKAAGELAPALFMSTLTTIIIFLPAAFVEGGDTFSDLLKAFQVPIVASLLASFVVALMILPLLSSRLLGNKAESSGRKGSNHSSEQSGGIFKWMSQRRHLVAGLGLLVCGLNFWLIKDIEEEDLGIPRDPYTMVNVKFSEETRPEDRIVWFEEVEKFILERKETIGFDFAISNFSSSFPQGSLTLYLSPSLDMDERLDHLDQVMKSAISELPAQAGRLVTVGYGGVGGSYIYKKKDTIRLEGTRMGQLLSLQKDIMNRVAQIEGVKKVVDEAEEKGRSHLEFVPHQAIVNSLGVDKQKISQAMSSLLRDYKVDNITYNGRPVAAKISVGDEAGSRDLHDLMGLTLAFGKGKQISVGELGEFVEASVVSPFSREDGKVRSRFYVYYEDGLGYQEVKERKEAVLSRLSTYEFPPGYGVEADRRGGNLAAMKAKSDFILYLSAFLIFLVLASLFESMFIPLAIMAAVPISVMFGLTGLRLLGMNLDVMARLSLIVLVGIGVNNAIVLVDVIERLRRDGHQLLDAIVKGCQMRFRSVLMSSTTTVLGVLPIAVGNSKLLGIPFSTLGITIISGMLFSTVIILFVLPVILELVVNLEKKVKIGLGI